MTYLVEFMGFNDGIAYPEGSYGTLEEAQQHIKDSPYKKVEYRIIQILEVHPVLMPHPLKGFGDFNKRGEC
jgi:hypothetical protein